MARDSKLWEEAYKAHKVHKVPVRQRPKKPPTQLRAVDSVNKELSEIRLQIKTLNARKKHLTKQLRESNVVSRAYLQKPIKLYALRLEGGNYYIGQSRNPEKRFTRHSIGKGAKWTRLHKPIEIIEIRDTRLTDDAEAALLEDEMTIEYALNYGHIYVRGGGYCQSKPQWPNVVACG